RPEFQSFLANGGDEALSGALKLARFAANREGRPVTGLVLAPPGRLEHFASLSPATGPKVELISDLVVDDARAADAEARIHAARPSGSVAVFPAEDDGDRERQRRVLAAVPGGATLIAAVDRDTLGAYRRDRSRWPVPRPPDVIAFDESFVHN